MVHSWSPMILTRCAVVLPATVVSWSGGIVSPQSSCEVEASSVVQMMVASVSVTSVSPTWEMIGP